LYVNAISKGYDIILVDGKWRVECARAAAKVMTDDTILLFHDWDREEYHVVLDELRVFGITGTLAMMRLK
jgi:hypothetical protein